MITKLNNTISNLKSLFIETFLNKTSKVSDVSDGSITNATAHGAAKLAQKTIKDVAIVEAQIFQILPLANTWTVLHSYSVYLPEKGLYSLLHM